MNNPLIPVIAGIFIIIVLCSAGMLDVFLGAKYGAMATVSFQIQTWCQKWPILYISIAWLLFHLTSVPCITKIEVEVPPATQVTVKVP
jgi:hypothetical protein